MKTKKINLFLLVLLVVSAIDSIRNLPSASIFGTSLIFFFALAALLFLIPTSLVSAELASRFPDRGGVYYWMAQAFGDKVGMLAIWLQWINTMVWYPTILSFIAGTAAYLIHPSLVSNRLYLITIILGIFWVLTLINLFGLSTSAKVNSIFGLVGTMFPMFLLIVLGIIWISLKKTIHVSFSLDTILPSLSRPSNWVSLTVIMASFLGIELSGVHINDIKNPQRNFPIAMGYSALFLLLTMVFGSLAIAVVLPQGEINLIAGVMQVFDKFFEAFHMRWAMPIMTSLTLIGSLAGIINWLISPAKGLLHSAEYGFLPKFFQKINKYGVAYNILIVQAVLVSAFCLVFFLVPGVNAFYWFLTGLSTDLYMMMYILMFLSALKLSLKTERHPYSYQIPGKKIGLWTTCFLGISGCGLTIVVSFFPPPHLTISLFRYSMLVCLGNILMIAPIFLFYFYRGRKNKKIFSGKVKDSIKEIKSRPSNTP